MADDVRTIDEWVEVLPYLNDPVRTRLVQAHGRYRLEGWVGVRWATLGGEVPVVLGRRVAALLAERHRDLRLLDQLAESRQESEPEAKP